MDIEGGQGEAGGGLELGKMGKERLAVSFIRRRHVDGKTAKKSENGKLGQQAKRVNDELIRGEVGNESRRKPRKMGQAHAFPVDWHGGAEQEQRRSSAWRLGRTTG